MSKRKVPVAAINLMGLADGFAGRAIDSALSKVTEDIIKRGEDRKKRSVTIRLDFTPTPDGRVKIGVQANSKLPDFIPSETLASIDHAAGGLMFSPDSAENPDQFALPGAGAADEE